MVTIKTKINTRTDIPTIEKTETITIMETDITRIREIVVIQKIRTNITHTATIEVIDREVRRITVEAATAVEAVMLEHIIHVHDGNYLNM